MARPTLSDPSPTANGDEEAHGAILALTVVLLSGLAGHRLLEQLLTVLVGFRVPPQAGAQLLTTLGDDVAVPHPDADDGTAVRAIQRGIASRRAMYLAAAGKRLKAGGSVTTEVRLFNAHRRAERKRAEAGERVDAAARQHGPILGWWNPLDERTTPLCRAAHGRNFRVDPPPEIGYPGTAHGGSCRCRPRAPWPDGTMLP